MFVVLIALSIIVLLAFIPAAMRSLILEFKQAWLFDPVDLRVLKSEIRKLRRGYQVDIHCAHNSDGTSDQITETDWSVFVWYRKAAERYVNWYPVGGDAKGYLDRKASRIYFTGRHFDWLDKVASVFFLFVVPLIAAFMLIALPFFLMLASRELGLFH